MGFYVSGSALTGAPASQLAKAYNKASKFMARTSKSLEMLEAAVIRKYDAATLEGFKKDEEVFLKCLIDIKKHEGLKNPYDLAKPSGALNREAGDVCCCVSRHKLAKSHLHPTGLLSIRYSA